MKMDIVANSGNDELILYDNKGRPFIIDFEDYERVSKFTWCQNSLGYICATIPNSGKRKMLLHRFIMEINDRNIKIDHINHKVNDNRKSNLRVCTHKENLANSHIRTTNKSGIKGVCKNPNGKKWVAYGVYDYKKYHIGTFDTLEEARLAREQWEKKYQKEFTYKGESK